MIVCSFDLEMAQPSGEIIEVGYTIGDIRTGEIKVSKGLIVNPHEELSDYIVRLTHITQEMVNSGYSLVDAYLEMVRDCCTHGAHRQPVVWGSGDLRTLKQQVFKSAPNIFSEEWSFGFTEMNVKTLVQGILTAKEKPPQGGLGKSLGKFGLKFKGTKHRAVDDAMNTFLLYRELLGRLRCLNL